MKKIYVILLFITASVFLTGCQIYSNSNLRTTYNTASNSKELALGKYYVTADRLYERLFPSKNAPSSNIIDYGQAVTVKEFKNGWARVSRYYDGSVEGINGTVARWVYAKYLSRTRPVSKTVGMKIDTPLKKVLSSSDDYHLYSKIFIEASKKLMNKDMCEMKEILWLRSQNYKPKPVYFTQCARVNSNIYLNVKTGELFY